MRDHFREATFEKSALECHRGKRRLHLSLAGRQSRGHEENDTGKISRSMVRRLFLPCSLSVRSVSRLAGDRVACTSDTGLATSTGLQTEQKLVRFLIGFCLLDGCLESLVKSWFIKWLTSLLKLTTRRESAKAPWGCCWVLLFPDLPAFVLRTSRKTTEKRSA